ncbi:hypothetical protein [Methylobacterium frigidaeris]|uniref:Uncharacterized protein n=1 Tax=Methylobacterium frigidaeris TaxID=2038277 RepID=A0AA37M8L1_9HYPH|nr:hypothetical protein [Methylobacterium frigidaeris]GJD66908.1 hypothetical protein MPEAHAMD_7107 [Methylobacterium frigidaeris]
MTHPPTSPEPLDVIAGELHDLTRHCIQGCPTWEDLDPSDPWEAGMIRLAYDRARALVEMGRDEA